MQRIEASFRFSGMLKAVAVFGKQFSYEGKSSKATMALYAVGFESQNPTFHIIIYDLAYINVSSIRVIKDGEFKKQLQLKKDTLKVKEGELLCPNKVVQTLDEIVCDAESMQMPDTILKVLDDTIEYIAAHYGTEKAYPNNIETVILSRIYALSDVEAT